MTFLPLDGIEAVLWDLDGTLVDSHSSMRKVWSDFGASLGIELDRDDQDLIFLMQSWDEVHTWFRMRSFDAPARDQLAEHILDRAVALAPSFTVFPDSAREVRRLDRHCMPQAVVTNSGRRYVDAVLHGTGLASSFGVTVARDDVQHGKPDPEAYLLAADRLGVVPGNCLVVEDTCWGAEAGEAAGCRVVRIDYQRAERP